MMPMINSNHDHNEVTTNQRINESSKEFQESHSQPSMVSFVESDDGIDED